MGPPGEYTLPNEKQFEFGPQLTQLSLNIQKKYATKDNTDTKKYRFGKSHKLKKQDTVTTPRDIQHCLPEARQALRLRGLTLHHDNVPSHTVALAVDFLKIIDSIALERPLYSGERAMWKFWLPFKIKKKMHGRRFTSEEEIDSAINEYFDLVTRDKRTCAPESRWSPPPIASVQVNTCNSRRDTILLLTFWIGIGYLIEEEWANRRGVKSRAGGGAAVAPRAALMSAGAPSRSPGTSSVSPLRSEVYLLPTLPKCYKFYNLRAMGLGGRSVSSEFLRNAKPAQEARAKLTPRETRLFKVKLKRTTCHEKGVPTSRNEAMRLRDQFRGVAEAWNVLGKAWKKSCDSSPVEQTVIRIRRCSNRSSVGICECDCPNVGTLIF
ncbi:hypothetical protein EVAR_13200_1 [Eumeta japonica]|uniref:Mariner Mos1 transposase n=1 Tax=Eumeta variegata TaxID=151549 RepID=A0A4C1TS46_EUMVA|nr:hypothetical protein EVAR_13200_1 [Eumeta japonica]